ncbi:putative Urea active transporter 1 [Seiridium cardinale]
MVSVSGLELVPQGTAYGLLIWLGILFCVVILAAIKVQKAYLSEDSGTSEMFMVANRSVGTGLTASAVFSSWMWINETVFAAAMCYRYGLAVPMIGHIVFIVLNLVNNVFGCASMILTGSQLIYGVSGMHFVAATILIPLGVVLYTAVVGGLYGLYDKVMATAAENYIPGNYERSLLTMKSRDAIIWGLILKFGNLALVVMDTAFWQKSFATEVNATVTGYNLAAVAIFGIPWGLGTVIGLTARAIHNTPIFPTYPDEFTSAQVNAGFVMPYTVKALIGDKGIVAFFVLLFMALTSTVSSSMIAVSSILSFDIYKTYWNPKASDKRLVKVSHIAVVIHAIFITAIALALNYGGANMTWIGYFRPIIACPGIIPLALTLLWSGQTRLAGVLSPILGFLTGLGIWLGTAKSLYGVINMTTTEGSLPALFGAIGSLFSPVIYSVIISQYAPYKFDWREFLRIKLAEEAQIHTSPPKSIASLTDEKDVGIVNEASTPTRSISDMRGADGMDPVTTSEKSSSNAKPLAAVGDTTPSSTSSRMGLDDIQHPFDEVTLHELARWQKVAWVMFIFVVLITFVLWPMPLYRDYVFTKAFFSS